MWHLNEEGKTTKANESKKWKEEEEKENRYV